MRKKIKVARKHIKIGDVLYYGGEFWRVLDIEDEKALCCLDCSFKYINGPVANGMWRFDGEDSDYLHSDLVKYIGNFENLIRQTEEENEKKDNLNGNRKEIEEKKAIILSGTWRMCDFWYSYKDADNKEVGFWSKMALISSTHVERYYKQIVKATDRLVRKGKNYCYFYVGDKGKAQLCIFNYKSKDQILYYNVTNKKACYPVFPIIVLNIENK